jgi:hypothetical protein
MTPKTSALAATLIIAFYASMAFGLDIYLNDVLITGVRDQEFENATVRLDSEGNVRIHAPQYRVERADRTDRGPDGSDVVRSSSAATPPSTPPSRPSTQRPAAAAQPASEPPPDGGGAGLSRRYWLVTQVNGQGMVQYRISVRINGRLVRSFTDADVPAPIEVTQYVRPGQNAVSVEAVKITEGGRRSESSRHWIRVVVADGHIEGSAVVIDRPGVIFTRNAAQTNRESRDYNLNAE